MNKLIVALGNPGRKYQNTRHNIGQSVLGHLACASGLVWKEKFKGLYSSIDINENKFIFLKPLTYMNLSGESVVLISHFFRITVQEILVVHDDLDFPFGVAAFKKGGGLAGHNGLRSIAESLANRDFLRMRLGIGRPQFGSESAWVLTEFSAEEKIVLEIYLTGAAKALQEYMEKGFNWAASHYSKTSMIPE